MSEFPILNMAVIPMTGQKITLRRAGSKKHVVRVELISDTSKHTETEVMGYLPAFDLFEKTVAEHYRIARTQPGAGVKDTAGVR
ncbi:MAG: hypothetical protein WC760_02815 [Bacteroidia bacterium]|jgi:hypothetical protein